MTKIYIIDKEESNCPACGNESTTTYHYSGSGRRSAQRRACVLSVSVEVFVSVILATFSFVYLIIKSLRKEFMKMNKESARKRSEVVKNAIEHGTVSRLLMEHRSVSSVIYGIEERLKRMNVRYEDEAKIYNDPNSSKHIIMLEAVHKETSRQLNSIEDEILKRTEGAVACLVRLQTKNKEGGV